MEQKNSLEQLCINFANEMLQRHFNVNVFQEEKRLYDADRLDHGSLDFTRSLMIDH
jgi:myosin V